MFVNLKDGGQPDFYVVPSKVVAGEVKEGRVWWLKTRGRHGQPHNATSMRMFDDDEGKCLGRCELLGL